MNDSLASDSRHGLAVDADVVILGGGPVGLLSALLLARLGHRSIVIERWPEPYGRPRAVSFDYEALRMIQKIDLAEEMDQAGIKQSWYDWRTEDGRSLLLFDHRPDGPTGWHTQIFNQPTFEAMLERDVAKEPLVTLLRGVEAVDADSISENEDSVSLTIRDTETQEPRGQVTGRYLIGADGANSVVHDKIGIPKSDLGFFFDWLICDVIPHGVDQQAWGDTGVQICSPKRPTTVVGGGPGRRRWEFMLLPGESIDEMNTEETAWRLLEPFGFSKANAELERHTVYTFQARWARRWNKGRLLLVGDAAHQMPPFAGQGLNSGIRDASNMVWKLDLVLRGKADPAFLDTLSYERREHIKYAIHFSIELGKVICVLDPEEARKRNEQMLRYHGIPELGLPPLPPEEFTSGLLYLRDGVPTPGAGTASPQFRVAGSHSEGLFDTAIRAGTTLLVRDGEEGALDATTRVRFDDVLGRVYRLKSEATGKISDDEVIDSSGGYGRELDKLGAVAVLWRPDGYYFGSAATAAEVPALVNAFVQQVTTGQFVITDPSGLDDEPAEQLVGASA